VNIVFAGTPDFAVPSLEALLQAGHRIIAVYTQPDRPAGRGRQLKPSAVKQAAQHHGLEVRQPQSLKGEAAFLRALHPDIMAVIAYGQILPKSILNTPVHGCVNVHASLLPRWRGAAPIPRAIEAGDTVSGVTIMQMDEGLDTGDILVQSETMIQSDDNTQTLHDRLAQLGAVALVETLEKLRQNALSPRPQDNAEACYAPKLRKDETPIDWSAPAQTLDRKIRALNPWPMATTRWRGKLLRIWAAEALNSSDRLAPCAPGAVVATDAGGIQIQTGKGILNVCKLQAEGGKPLDARAFLNGHRLSPGDRLG